MVQKLTLPIEHSSGKQQAQVHCVIVGFSAYKNNKEKKIYDSDGNSDIVQNINPYLVNAPNILIKRRTDAICGVSEMVYGNKPTDGGFLLLDEDEKEKIVKDNPLAEKWVRQFIGAEEFLNGKKRWCLWLVGANPSELRKCKLVIEKIEKVKNFRLKSKKAATRKLADISTLFAEIRQPNTNYILIPSTTSGNRKYIPIGFINKNVIASNATHIIPNATLYHFGVLTSNVHMAWMRAVCGRLGNGYRYSKDIVYNNFIWANPTPKQKKTIENVAQEVLDARKLYSDSTLADLYDPNTMPPELVNAHNKLDNAVKEAYGTKGFETEEETVESLMKMYKEAIDKKA